VADAHREQVLRRLTDALRLVDAGSVIARRIESAPAGYALAQTSSDIARHAALLEPVPRDGEVRVLATPGRSSDTWHVDIASLDRPGLLATFTGVLVHAGIDVAQAVIATWSDRAALQALVVRSGDAPEVDALRGALEWALSQPLSAPPVTGASMTFDHSTSSAYTSCEVTAVDQPGLLHAVAVAIANAGADIHAASVATVDGVARDRFDLTDQSGRKLTPALEDAIAANLRAGFSGVVATRRVRV
jgi:[protein-PII] uridylyltransferase